MLYRITAFWIVVIGFVAAAICAVGAVPAELDAATSTGLIDIPQDATAFTETAASVRIADTSARPDGVRLTTTWKAATLNRGDTIINTLDVYHAIAGQKIRLQNSNHGAGYFTTSFSAAVQAAIAVFPNVSATPITAELIEIELAAGTYAIPIAQTVARRRIPGAVDDAPWIAGTQLQVDWLLSSAPSGGAPVEPKFAVNSRWINYTQQGEASEARWSLLRSIPNIGAGGTVNFEIGMTNHELTSSATLHIAADAASTANDASFARGLNASIAAALNDNVSFDPQSGTLTFGPKMSFPFIFAMTARAVDANKDYILDISDNQIGQIDVAQAGVRLGTLSLPSTTPLLGLNESSGEFGVGSYTFKYAYPGHDRFDWAAALGFGIIRVPFLFQNIQTSSGAPLNEAAMRQLDPVLNQCAVKHIVCLLDMHNYGSYYLDDSSSGQGLPGSVDTSNTRLAKLWGEIARRYMGNPFVWFDLMNEPHQQTALEWVKTDNAIAAAIRATGAANKIVFQGTAWQGAWTWTTSGNAKEMLKAYDPGNNYAFEAHQYLDRDGSGTSPICVPGAGAARLRPFTAWLQANELHGILGEVGWADNAGCAIEAAALLDDWRAATTSTAAGGYIGLTYWAAGPWWPNGYMYLAEPRPFPAGDDPAQLRALKSHLRR